MRGNRNCQSFRTFLFFTLGLLTTSQRKPAIGFKGYFFSEDDNRTDTKEIVILQAEAVSSSL